MRNERKREAVKRSVHFLIPDEFSRSLKSLVPNFTRLFWKPLDDKGDVRKHLRDSVWTVWGNEGVDTLSTNFTHDTKLVTDKMSNSLILSLKETGGKLTELTRTQVTEQVSDDADNSYDIESFERAWHKIIKSDLSYPSYQRPITSSVADVISKKYNVPLPVVLGSMIAQFQPGFLSNGLLELYHKTMPDEVFSQEVFDEAMRNGEVERLDHWRFKVKKKSYQDWRMRNVTSIE